MTTYAAMTIPAAKKRRQHSSPAREITSVPQSRLCYQRIQLRLTRSDGRTRPRSTTASTGSPRTKARALITSDAPRHCERSSAPIWPTDPGVGTALWPTTDAPFTAICATGSTYLSTTSIGAASIKRTDTSHLNCCRTRHVKKHSRKPRRQTMVQECRDDVRTRIRRRNNLPLFVKVQLQAAHIME